MTRDPQKRKAARRRDYIRHKAAYIARAKARYERLKNDPDFVAKLRAAGRKWNASGKAGIWMAKWRKSNPDKAKATEHRFYKKHAERIRERARNQGRLNRIEVLAHYGNACACCGEAVQEFLVIDHINGCGPELRKTHGQGSAFYWWLKRHGFPEGFQTLCHNCNMAKSLYDVCPHQSLREQKP